jgi:hypothetical protein
MFAVKSAYRLAQQEEQGERRQTGSSSRPDGSRALYKSLWTTLVLTKVRIFAWRLAQEGLATQCNRQQRKLIRNATCQICGADDMDGHHAVVRCTKARALHYEMRKLWCLPDEAHFQNAGANWLLLLLDSLQPEVRAHILLLFWCAWHLRNDVVHGDDSGSVMGSAKFLASHSDSLRLACQAPGSGVSDRGKGKVQEVCRRAQEEGACLNHGMEPMPRWTPPSEGWVRINTDAAYCHDSGSASAGIIARDVDGKVLLSAWKWIRNCGSLKQTEAEACLEGLRLAAEWIHQPIWVESDCASLIQALGRTTDARSSIFGILSEIQAVKNIGLSQIVHRLFKLSGEQQTLDQAFLGY